MTAKDDDQAPWDDVPDSITHGDGLDWDALAAKAMRRDHADCAPREVGRLHA